MASILPRLIVRDTFGSEREVEISRTPFSLGRQNDNDLVLPDNRISRCHAHILHKGDEYLIEDASSRHGTFVNGGRVVSHSLQPGDQIRLSVSDAYRLTFGMEEPVLPSLLDQIGKVTETPGADLNHLGRLL